jgi:LPXTG-site transpeptidase (sortase) family protein
MITFGSILTAVFVLGQSLYFPAGQDGQRWNLSVERSSRTATVEARTDGVSAETATSPNGSSSVTGDSSNSASSASSYPPSSKPARLQIPKIGVNAHVQHVGVARSGNMAVPDNFTDVGWFRNGPTPGATGSSVIAGHVDNAMGSDGVFKRLDELRLGDSVFVVRSDGKRLEFRVIDIKIHPYNLRGPALDKIFADSTGTYLNLITCTGEWLPSARTNDKRLVVYTKLVGN